MNTISHATDTVDVEEDVLDEDDMPTGETTTVTYTVLRITVSHKTADEMTVQCGFNDEQKEWLAELLKPDYHGLWNGLLYGITSVGDGSLIEIADTQIGNIGGEPYWSWFGWTERVEWCACFVSWVAEQCGFIDAGIIPKFSGCTNGAQWFQDRDQWQDNTYTPAPGDIIFFDWEPDGETDHVGIVESVVDGVVNTIEGNSSDSVRRRSYEIGSIKIFGYGIPLY
jgi:cell wall-associated NlpC family hydrolase